MLELAISCVVSENGLSRVELMCCINDWRGKRGGKMGREKEGEGMDREKYMQESKW